MMKFKLQTASTAANSGLLRNLATGIESAAMISVRAVERIRRSVQISSRKAASSPRLWRITNGCTPMSVTNCRMTATEVITPTIPNARASNSRVSVMLLAIRNKLLAIAAEMILAVPPEASFETRPLKKHTLRFKLITIGYLQ